MGELLPIFVFIDLLEKSALLCDPFDQAIHTVFLGHLFTLLGRGMMKKKEG